MNQNCYKLPNFMEQHPSEAVFVTCIETPIILRYTKIHYNFQSVLYMILSWAKWVQFTLAYPVSLIRLMLILPSHLGLVCASGLLTSGFPIRILHALLGMWHITWPSHLRRFDCLNNVFCWQIQIMKLLVMKFSISLPSLTPLRPKYFPQHSVIQHILLMWQTKFHTHMK